MEQMMDRMARMAPDHKIVYKTAHGIELPLHVYLPRCRNGYNRIPVVCIHGGGWNSGMQDGEAVNWDGGHMVHQARYFAALGYVGIVISYRSLKNADTDILDLIEDCEDAVIFIKEKLDFIDRDKMILMGDSAGGHLAACLGISQDDRIRPAMVVACNPVLDCRTRFNYASDNEKHRIAASPIVQEPVKCADFIFVHGDADSITPVRDTIFFHEKLQKLHFHSKLIILRGVEHAFILWNYHSSDAEVLEYMEEIVRSMQGDGYGNMERIPAAEFHI